MLETKTTLVELRNLLKTRKISVTEVCSFYWNRSKKYQPKINAYITFNENIWNEARQADDCLKNQNYDQTPLYGIPLGIKDMFCTKGIRTTAASRMLENFIPHYDATVIKKLKKSGALILGKLNQDEFAMGSSSENSFFGPSLNPWNLNYVPGGSSGGSAASVAASLCPASLGTDTGGSIRQPAHFCGVVGIKPTYGRVSRFGIIAFASSLDQAGPIAKTVEDVALVLESMCGHDNLDQTSSNHVVPKWSAQLNPNVKGRKVGIIKEFLDNESLDVEVRSAIEQVISYLKNEGAIIVPISIPLVNYGVSIYYLIASSEASSNLARYDGVRYGHRADFKDIHSVTLEDFYAKTRGEGFGTEVKTRIMLGTYCLSSGYYDAYYKKASQVRRLLRDQFLSVFKEIDVILSPVATTAAFRLQERVHDPVQMYFNDIFTVPINLAGLCSISVPVILNSSGLPIGIQLIGRPFDEQGILDFAYSIEKEFLFYRRYENELPGL